jgi:hypothetical protein
MEAIQIDFDPAQISFDRLLEVFWKSHNPFSRSWSRQYASAVFYTDEGQKKAALASQARLEKARGRAVRTEIVPLDRFHPAEAYHQKYRLRGTGRFFKEFKRLYPMDTDRALVRSTVAARLNGYLAGEGTLKQLAEELPLLGLSPPAQRRLWDAVRSRFPSSRVACPLPEEMGFGGGKGRVPGSRAGEQE